MDCCAVIHATVLSCNEDGPVNKAMVYATREPIPPDETEPVTVSGETDESGTVTLLVKHEATYEVRGHYNGSDANITVEAECGVNNALIHFDATDQICIFATVNDGGSTGVEVIATQVDEDFVPTGWTGTCTTVSSGECCLTIPVGEARYRMNFYINDQEVTEPQIVIVAEKQCGDMRVDVALIDDTETCTKHICLQMCGCLTQGRHVTITLPNTAEYGGTTGPDGCADIVLPLDLCDDFVGSHYIFEGMTQDGVELEFHG
jgi:hypothetical protein